MPKRGFVSKVGGADIPFQFFGENPAALADGSPQTVLSGNGQDFNFQTFAWDTANFEDGSGYLIVHIEELYLVVCLVTLTWGSPPITGDLTLVVKDSFANPISAWKQSVIGESDVRLSMVGMFHSVNDDTIGLSIDNQTDQDVDVYAKISAVIIG